MGSNKLRLFDTNSDAPDFNKINIDEEYARRLKHNKEREDIHRLEELKKKGIISNSENSSDDDESSEDDEGIDSKKMEKFIDALNKIKRQDPILKNKESKLFDSDSDSESDDDQTLEKGDKKTKKKKMLVKDYNAKLLIDKGADYVDDLEDDVGFKVKSRFEEETEIRNEIVKNLEKEESGKEGDLFIPKEANGGDDDDEGGEYEEKLNEYFKDESLDENESFLKEFFAKRLWEKKAEGNGGDVDLSEDEEEIEKQEEYERSINFRFEENTGDRILGHSRKVEGSVRKKTNVNKVQRDRKKERMEQAEMERKEELKRLKNLKKKEMNEKIKKIRETAGIKEDEACAIELDDLEGEFDPEEHDRKMKKAFGGDYYEADDVDPGFGSDDEDGDDLVKPDFDKEDELLGLPKGWVGDDTAHESFESVREKALKQKAESEGKKISDIEKEVREKMMEEYYKLDYEDTIGDLKTRFKYRPVKAKQFGLDTVDVLMMDDKELNEYVSIKKLAPYREKDWEVPHARVQQMRKKNRGLRGESSDATTVASKKRKSDKDMETTTAVTATESAAEGSLSRKSKRRMRNAELKPSQARLMAYGLGPSKPKGKK